jgi:diguanylate cyclase (GGDEF)-like protein/PAS domain S-box-containing protein
MGVKTGALGTTLENCSKVLSIRYDHHPSTEIAAKDYTVSKSTRTIFIVPHYQLPRDYLQRTLKHLIDNNAGSTMDRNRGNESENKLRQTDVALGLFTPASPNREQQRSPEASVSSALQMETLADLAPIGIFKSDANGANTYTNLAWQEISGLTPQQSLGSGWLDCIHRDDLGDVMVKWSEAVRSESAFQTEFRILRPRYVSFRARRVLSEQTHDFGFIGAIEDITERRLLDQERNEHRLVIESSLNEIYIFDAETLKFEFANEGARRNLGYAMSELRQMTPVDIKPLFNLAKFEAAIEPLRSKRKEILVFQTIHRRADGTDYNVEVRLQMSIKAQRPVFVAIILDITDRVSLEAEKAKTNTLQRAILEHAAYAIIATTPEGIITNFNPAAERLLGYTSSELVGLHSPGVFHLESEVVERAQEFSLELGIDLQPGFEVFVCKSTLRLVNEHAWTYVRKDGTHVPVMLGISALRDDTGQITGYLGIAKDITQQKNYEEQLAAAAVTDTLTNLPNRVLLLDRLQIAIARAKKKRTHFACMFLDFDRFKAVNDSWGHAVGDELLRQIADRLRQEVNQIESAGSYKVSIVARLGGDEFVVVVEDLGQVSESDAIAKRLQESLAHPYQLGQHQFCSTASIGIVNGPSLYDGGEEILRDADTAMYEAKHAGRARHIVFNDEMHTQVHRRMLLKNELRNAIGTDQLTLHYQPIASLVDGRVAAVEALLRWTHPVLGSISPAEFIPIAQESDSILRLGEWVLAESCRQLSQWQATLGPAAPGKVSINLARKQFEEPSLPREIARLLNMTGLRPQCLQLEITEESFALNVERAIQTMESIRELGVTLAIDDFGSGTASFAALHQFPIDVLKVDRSLIKHIETSTGEAAFMHGLVVMARNLNIQLVAEGIETLAQLRAVQELGCQFMQGYYFAKPMSPDNLESFLKAGIELSECVTGAMAFTESWTQHLPYYVPSSNR